MCFFLPPEFLLQGYVMNYTDELFFYSKCFAIIAIQKTRNKLTKYYLNYLYPRNGWKVK